MFIVIDSDDITEILLKVALNTITPNPVIKGILVYQCIRLLFNPSFRL